MPRLSSTALALPTYRYADNRVFSGSIVKSSMVYSYFPGGYFDADGAPHFLHTDYQGSVVMVTDSAGRVEQHTAYYPYGEPHREPAGQPILYAGKKRLRTTADYAYGARRHHAPLINWTVPDPKAHDYLPTSPYAFCSGNPIKNIDIDGAEWTIVYNVEHEPIGFEWIDPEECYDSNKQLLPEFYKTAILFSSEGAKKEFNPNNAFNIGSSLCTVYKEDGSTEFFDACTYPSDITQYSMIPDGRYEAQTGLHKDSYKALRVGDCGTHNFYNNKISLDSPNKKHPKQSYIKGGNIHKAGINNCTGMTKAGKAISQACLLIDRFHWDDFISLFEDKQTIGILIKR